jgi:hypothetical protein
MVGPDGKELTGTINSHDFSMKMLPYEKMLDVQRKGEESQSRADARAAQLENAAKRLELQGMLNEAKILKLQAQGGSTKLDREERMRFTTLFTDAGRRMQDVSKAINTLQGDRQFMRNANKEGTPEAQQLAQLRAEKKQHEDERTLYQGLLAGDKGAKQPSLADADPKPGGKAAPKAGEMPAPQTKADYDKLPPGTRYRHPDGTVKVKK